MIAALTGNQCIKFGAEALKMAGGFLEKGSHSSERADYQPARHLEGFFFWRGLFSRQSASANAGNRPGTQQSGSGVWCNPLTCRLAVSTSRGLTVIIRGMWIPERAGMPLDPDGVRGPFAGISMELAR